MFSSSQNPLSPTLYRVTSPHTNKFQRFGRKVDDQLCHHADLSILFELLETTQPDKVEYKQLYDAVD